MCPRGGGVSVPGDLMAVVADQGLTDAARVIAVRLYSMGGDWHELSPDDFSRMVAGYPQRDTVRKHLRQLEMAGYIERKPGGRGHSDRFRFVFSVGAESQPKNLEWDSDQIASERNPTLKPRSSSKEEVGDTPLLSPQAEQAIEQHVDLLSGCRGALTDYLRSRVPSARQGAYVQSLATYLNGFGFQWRNAEGATIPREERTGIIAAALNELGSQDEPGMKNPVGDIRNLRTKLGILSREWGRTVQARGTGTDGPSGLSRSDRKVLRQRADLENFDLNQSRSVFDGD